MTRLRLYGLLSLGFMPALLAGCASRANQPPPVIHYVAIKMPSDIQPQTTTGGQTLSKRRIGFFYRPPLDLVGSLDELTAAPASGVLIDVEAKLQVPFCVVFFCFGQDTITAAKTAPQPVVSAAPQPPPAPSLPDTPSAAAPALPSAPRDASPPPPPPLTLPRAGHSRGKAVVLDRPTGTATVLQTLDPGAEMELTNSLSNASGKWWYVRVNGRGGWVKAEDVDPEN